MTRKILAVAVGSHANTDITTRNAPANARPYVQGLIDWLRDTTRNDPTPDDDLDTYEIGPDGTGDYKILYREAAVGNLASVFTPAAIAAADLILCMSTSVANAAVATGTTKPIVAIVSDPVSEGLVTRDNVCGVSAGRDRLASSQLKVFRKRHQNLKDGKVFVLHRQGYPPSDRSRAWLDNRVVLKAVGDTQQNLMDVIAEIVADTTVANDHKGVLVLPADRFFGSAADIINSTQNIRTFWSTPDFPVMNSFGGFGISQNLCGRYLAERVATIWTNQDASSPPPDPFPIPKWVVIDAKPTLRIRP
jgi:hypothetical protein